MHFSILIEKDYHQAMMTFIVNLCLIMGKYHIHIQKWAKGKPYFFVISNRFETLN